MGKSLYRSYRSRSFDEIIGQDHITTVLKNSLANNSISHAYLLSGPKGVGKTSIARILAFEVNGQPYNEESTNLDIIEIDAASNRRIDEIREIRERIHIAPTLGKYKIYIIDEVHMLTREAFNALLKTLEEPPAHAIFILATTEVHKVPETIVSRCIRLGFKPINSDVMAKHLKDIAKKENISISIGAIKLLSQHARGSFRDGISLLEQVKHSSDTIDIEEVNMMLGLTSESRLNDIVSAIGEGNLQKTQKSLQLAYDSGANESTIASQLGEKFRNVLLDGKDIFDTLTLLKAQDELLRVPGSPKPRTALELCLFNIASLNHINPDVPITRPLPPLIAEDSSAEPVTEIKISAKVVNDNNEINTIDDISDNVELWPKLLIALKKKNNTLYGIARMAEVKEDTNSIHLTFKFAFHLKQISDSKNRAIFSELLEKINGRAVDLTMEHLKTTANKSEQPTPSNDSFQNVSNIFGAHEVLES